MKEFKKGTCLQVNIQEEMENRPEIYGMLIDFWKVFFSQNEIPVFLPVLTV